MRSFQILKNTGSAALLFLAAGFGSLLLATPAGAVTPAEADLAFNSLNKVYWDQATKFFRKEEQGPKKADFWMSAHLWETVMDQFERTGSADVRRQIDDLYDTFVKDNPDWTKNRYNDDIMWWSIACARAYKITNDERYLKKAKASFDFVYDNFTDDVFGGGVYWVAQRTSKNSCVNSPTVIAAVRLSVLLKDPSYLEKAKSVYAWQKKTLTDGTGKVFDAISGGNRGGAGARGNRGGPTTQANRGGPTTRINRGSLTYNQGTFIGAAVLLYQQTKDKTYLDDAIITAQWTKDNLCVTDLRILRSENQGDGGTFKGIFVRYMKLLINDCGRTEFLPWMKANADSAWRNRRPADNIIGPDWTVPPGPRIESQTATSAVAVILNFADDQPRR